MTMEPRHIYEDAHGRLFLAVGSSADKVYDVTGFEHGSAMELLSAPSEMFGLTPEWKYPDPDGPGAEGTRLIALAGYDPETGEFGDIDFHPHHAGAAGRWLLGLPLRPTFTQPGEEQQYREALSEAVQANMRRLGNFLCRVGISQVRTDFGGHNGRFRIGRTEFVQQGRDKVDRLGRDPGPLTPVTGLQRPERRPDGRWACYDCEPQAFEQVLRSTTLDLAWIHHGDEVCKDGAALSGRLEFGGPAPASYEVTIHPPIQRPRVEELHFDLEPPGSDMEIPY